MSHKILFRWLLLVVTPFIAGISIYRFLVGPISPYVQLATPFIFLTLVPIAYLSMDWNYVQTTRYNGVFGEAYPPINMTITFPGEKFGSVDIKRFDIYHAHLSRWAIYTKRNSTMTFFYDRLTDQWYYHHYDQKSEELLNELKKFKPG